MLQIFGPCHDRKRVKASEKSHQNMSFLKKVLSPRAGDSDNSLGFGPKSPSMNDMRSGPPTSPQLKNVQNWAKILKVGVAIEQTWGA